MYDMYKIQNRCLTCYTKLTKPQAKAYLLYRHENKSDFLSNTRHKTQKC